MGLDSLAQGLITKAKTLATPKNVAIGVGSAAVLGAGTVGAIALTRKRKKSKRKKKSYSPKKRSKRSRRRYTPHTAGKGKDRSTKRIRYTKKGQPYRIMANGRARFIKKKGARLSHKRKGGRY